MFDTLTENLKSRGFGVSCFETAKDAVAYLETEINGKTVGFGGSITLEQIGLKPALSKNNTVYWHQGVANREESLNQMKQASDADVYISSVNGIAETGEIINIDGNCNRVSAILYGHKKVYLVAGKNKIAEDFDKALYRARNVAAPLNAKRLNKQTPCAVKTDRCYNCTSPQRICRALTVLWDKPLCCDFEVVLINENLGY